MTTLNEQTDAHFAEAESAASNKAAEFALALKALPWEWKEGDNGAQHLNVLGDVQKALALARGAAAKANELPGPPRSITRASYARPPSLAAPLSSTRSSGRPSA
jgi:hypothetical protein